MDMLTALRWRAALEGGGKGRRDHRADLSSAEAEQEKRACHTSTSRAPQAPQRGSVETQSGAPSTWRGQHPDIRTTDQRRNWSQEPGPSAKSKRFQCVPGGPDSHAENGRRKTGRASAVARWNERRSSLRTPEEQTTRCRISARLGARRRSGERPLYHVRKGRVQRAHPRPDRARPRGAARARGHCQHTGTRVLGGQEEQPCASEDRTLKHLSAQAQLPPTLRYDNRAGQFWADSASEQTPCPGRLQMIE
eukprot:3375245-Pyramimonas_sp.AAC.1